MYVSRNCEHKKDPVAKKGTYTVELSYIDGKTKKSSKLRTHKVTVGRQGKGRKGSVPYVIRSGEAAAAWVYPLVADSQDHKPYLSGDYGTSGSINFNRLLLYFSAAPTDKNSGNFKTIRQFERVGTRMDCTRSCPIGHS
jgi:hypothetical protein